MLAEKTGWSLDYLLWELPISALAQLEHAMLYSGGARTVRLADRDKIIEELDRALNKYGGS